MEMDNGGEWAVALRFRKIAFNRIRCPRRFATLARQALLKLAKVDWSTFKPDQFLRQGDGV